MQWEVSFLQLPPAVFNDASNYGVEVDGDLFDSLRSIIDKGHGSTMTGGISLVKREFGESQPGEAFYILNVKREGKKYNFLFRLSEKEKSKLVGNSPSLPRQELVDVLYEVLSQRVDEVNLLI